MRRTRWFPISIKPIRVGRYEVAFDGEGVRMMWWDGCNWRLWAPDGRAVRMYAGDEWRGLTEPHQ